MHYSNKYFLYFSNGYKIYMDFMTGQKLSLKQVASMEVTYWSVSNFIFVNHRLFNPNLICATSLIHLLFID